MSIDTGKITRLECPEDILILSEKERVSGSLNDGYNGVLVCAGNALDEENLQMMVREFTNVVYFLGPSHIEIVNGEIRQKAFCRRYERGGIPALFEIIDERLFK